jgi:hypothetical protein
MLCGRENGDINAAEFDGAYGSAAMQKPRIQRTARGDCGGKKDLHSMVVSGDDKPNAHPTMTASSAATNCKRVRLQKQVSPPALCRVPLLPGLYSVRLRRALHTLPSASGWDLVWWRSLSGSCRPCSAPPRFLPGWCRVRHCWFPSAAQHRATNMR